MTRRRWHRAAVLAPITLMAAGALEAQDAAQAEADQAALEGKQNESGSLVDVEGSVFRTDNALRTPTEPLEDTIYMLGARVHARHDGANFDASIDGDLDWLAYDKADYDSRVLGFADALLSVSNRSGGLRWDLRESYGQLRRDAYAAETVENYEEVNFLTTGPQATFHLAPSTILVTYAEISRASHEDSSLDSDQWSVGVSLKQGSRPDAGLSVHLIGERNEFGDAAPVGSDFDSYVGFLRWEALNSRMTLSVDGGYTRVTSDFTEDNAPLVRLVAQRTLGAATSIYLNAGQEFSTAASAMRKSAQDRVKFGSTAGGQYSHLATTDAFLNRNAELGYNYDRRRTRFTVALTWNQERYVNDTSLDRDSEGIFAAVSRQVRPTLSMRLEGSFRNEKFIAGGSDGEESYVLFDINKDLGRHTSLVLSYQVFERSDAENPLSAFDEERYGIAIRHRLLERR
jgi:hypothetical protein